MLICDKGVWGRGNPKIIQHVVNLAAFPGDDPNFGDVLVLPETSHSGGSVGSASAPRDGRLLILLIPGVARGRVS